MGNPAGIKETKEAALGLVYLSKELVKAYKQATADGSLDINDLPAALGLLMDPEFMTKLSDAVDGFDQIGDEIADLSLMEGVELVKDVGMAVLDAVKEIKSIPAKE